MAHEVHKTNRVILLKEWTLRAYKTKIVSVEKISTKTIVEKICFQNVKRVQEVSVTNNYNFSNNLSSS